MTARDQLVAVAVHDALLILDDLESRGAIDARKAGDIRWAAIRVSGNASAEESTRFWAGYAELVILSERLGSRAPPSKGPFPAPTVPAACGRDRSWGVARYGAIAAALFALVLAVDNVGILVAPGQDDPRPPVVASNGAVLSAALDTARPLAAMTAFETEPAYFVAYGRDHPNFPPPPARPPARFDPPQMGM